MLLTFLEHLQFFEIIKHEKNKDIDILFYGSLFPRRLKILNELAEKAAGYGIALTVDAEEVDRLEISLKIIEAILETPALKDWDGFGLAVQAYQKRCLPLIKQLANMAQQQERKIRVRLVKGAYWDTEIKRAQVMGLGDYPLFTRKASTDSTFAPIFSSPLRCWSMGLAPMAQPPGRLTRAEP